MARGKPASGSRCLFKVLKSGKVRYATKSGASCAPHSSTIRRSEKRYGCHGKHCKAHKRAVKFTKIRRAYRLKVIRRRRAAAM